MMDFVQALVLGYAPDNPAAVAVARNRITATQIASAVSAGTVTIGSFSTTANRLVLLAVVNRVSSGTANEPTVTGTARTWTKVLTYTDASGGRRCTVFRAMNNSDITEGATLDFAGQTQANTGYSVDEFADVDISGVNGSGAVVQSAGATANSTSVTATLSAFGDSYNATYGAGRVGALGGTTPGSGFTELSDVVSGAGYAMFTEWRNDNDTTVDYSAISANHVIIGIEIKAGPSAALLLESGDYLLLESGDKLALE
jgi:hypothetical protein